MKIVDQVVRQILKVDLQNDYGYLFNNGEDELSEQNLTQVMGVIEEKVTEIVMAKAGNTG
jgi:hypothetical protein